ncbi:protein kinase [candidate division NPL-UPA2 bacterium]|nr:protein kinase [candidate division NPL-UPA2 bacterium]
MIETGSILDERYKILKLIGKGGMGRVFLAENIKLGNKWAIKEIDFTADIAVNLLAEPEMLKKLNYKSLPRIVDIIKTEKFIYIVEDFFAGDNLKEVLKSRERCSEKNLINWAKQLCEILIYLHSLKPNPIIYRDMKPGNIIVDNDNNIKLIDFGIAREYKKGQEEDTTYIGTRGYAAPEQLSKSGQSDERTDIYGLGVTLHHVLTGSGPDEPPYYLRPVREIKKHLSEGIEKIIAKCVQDDPGKRYRSAAALLEDLNNIHKLNRAYKINKVKKAILITTIIALISSGAYTINLGFLEFEIERKEAYLELMARGIAYFNVHNLDQAQLAFSTALPYGYDARPSKYLARIYLKRNKNQEAINLIEQAASRGEMEMSGEAMSILGSAYFNLAQYSRAIDYFERAITAKQDAKINIIEYVELYRDLAVSYGRTGDFTRAAEILDKLSAVEAVDAHIITYISGENKRAKGDLTAAVDFFARVVLEDPHNTRYKNSYADLLLQINRQRIPVEEQIQNYEKVILLASEVHKLDALNIHALNHVANASYNLAILIERTDKERARNWFEEALLAFKTLLDLGFRSSDDYINIGLIQEKLGENEAANNMFLQALALSPDNSRANLVYGLFKISQNEYEAAFEFLQKTVELAQSTSDVTIAQNKINELKEKGWGTN